MHNKTKLNKKKTKTTTYDLKRKRLILILRSIVLSQRLVILHPNPMAWLEICSAYNKKVQCT